MSHLVLPTKLVGETITATFNFLANLAVGESVSTASCSAAVYSGTDASPAAVLSGSPTVSSPSVTQRLTAGTEGVTYLITCNASTSAGQVLSMTAFLSIVPGSL